MTWRSLHVYAHDGQDRLVAGPLADWLDIAEPHAPRSFFIRYWRGGPHLRLRFDGGDLSAVRSRIAADLAAHRTEHALDAESFAADQATYAALEGVDGEPELVPDLSVLEAPYEPEYGKYGGPRGVEIAEELFIRSTRVVLAGTGDEDPAGAPLATLFAALHASGMGQEEMLRFLGYYSGLWSGYVAMSEWMRWDDRVRDTGPEAFDRVADLLHGPGPSAGLGVWAHAVDDALTAVRAGAEAVCAGIDQMDPLTDSVEHHLLGHYLHTHFNRMGVTADEESFLGHLAQYVLERVGYR